MGTIHAAVAEAFVQKLLDEVAFTGSTTWMKRGDYVDLDIRRVSA
jgi:hypothetical protein